SSPRAPEATRRPPDAPAARPSPLRAGAAAASCRAPGAAPGRRASRDIRGTSRPPASAAPGSSSHARLSGRIDPAVEPGHRVVEGPEIEGEVRLAGSVPAQHVEHDAPARGEALEKPRALEFPLHGTAEIAAEPLDHRRAEAHFRAVDDRVRH